MVTMTTLSVAVVLLLFTTLSTVFGFHSGSNSRIGTQNSILQRPNRFFSNRSIGGKALPLASAVGIPDGQSSLRISSEGRMVWNGIGQSTGPSSSTTTTSLFMVAASPSSPSSSSDPSTVKAVPSLMTLWRFSRPHTLIGSALAIPALHAQAAPSMKAFFASHTAKSVLYACVPALLMNLYITGLNQITDVDIDRINKPYLPIPAGELSLGTAKVVVAVSLLLSLWMGGAHEQLGTQGLNMALWGSGILGTMYSLPPFRLKRFPLLAALCIVAVRGAIVNAAFFAHAKAAAFGTTGASVWSIFLREPTCRTATMFFAVFGVVIALMKDVR